MLSPPRSLTPKEQEGRRKEAGRVCRRTIYEGAQTWCKWAETLLGLLNDIIISWKILLLHHRTCLPSPVWLTSRCLRGWSPAHFLVLISRGALLEWRAHVYDVWNKADDSTRCEESDSLRLLDGFGWLCLYYLSSRCDSSVRDVNKRKSWQSLRRSSQPYGAKQSVAERHEALMHLCSLFFMLFMSYLRHLDSENTGCFSPSAIIVHNVFFYHNCSLFKTESTHLHDFMFTRT